MDPELPSYVDDGALREQDRVPLRAFLSDHDRAQPTGRGLPFFSGREAEVNAFRDAANGILIGRQANATVVVEGPPGAGKSALLAQFQEEMLTFPPVGGSGRCWLPVLMDGAEACSPAMIMRTVDNAIAVRLAQEAISQQGTARERAIGRFWRMLEDVGWKDPGQWVKDRVGAARRVVEDHGITAAGFGLGAQADLSGMSMRDLAFRRGAAWRDWQVVLLIDEAQGISNEAPGAVPGTLSVIHQGFTGLHITFCASGLPGTKEALARVNVSRSTIRRSRRLGGLDDRASRFAVGRCFAQYGVTHGGNWQEAILSRSANWPQHLAIYLNAAFAVLQRNALAPDAMGDARRSPLDEAIRIGDKDRAQYYGERMLRLKQSSRWHGRYAKALVTWMTREGSVPPDRDEDEIIDYLSGPPLDLTKAEVTRFLDAAHHAGLLETLPDNKLRLPIPSFAGHLLEESLPPIPPTPPQ